MTIVSRKAVSRSCLKESERERIDDHPRQPGRVENPFLQVEVPGAVLLRQQAALQAVGQAGDGAVQRRELLVEEGAQPVELLRRAEVLRVHDLVVLGGEDLVVDLRLVAAAEIGAARFAGRLLVGGAVVLGEILRAGVGLLGGARILLLALALHLLVGGILHLLLGFAARGFAVLRRALGVVAALVVVAVGFRTELLAHVERDEQVTHRLGEGMLVFRHGAQPVELTPGLALDRLAPKLDDLARAFRRACAGQPLAHHQRERVLHRRFRLLGDVVENSRDGICPAAWRKGCSRTPSMRREPSASQRACSTASKIAFACRPSGE